MTATLFHEADILEFAEGRVGDLFGSRYALIDSLRRRVRVPGPPMMAISRVTSIQGEFGRLRGARIVTEYDIPDPFWNSVNGHVSASVLDPQGIQFLAGWLGVDLITNGECSYRWVAGQLSYYGALPAVGQRVETEIRLLRSNQRAGSIVCSIEFEVRVADNCVLKGDRCLVGFFSDEQLSKTIENTSTPSPPSTMARSFRPPLEWKSRVLEPADLVRLSRGEIADVFTEDHAVGGTERTLRLVPRIGQFVDRVYGIDITGGARGLGYCEGEFRLDPLHWAVRAHFKDDPVFPGPCMLEGATQLLQVYALAVGLQAWVHDGRFQPVVDRPIYVRFWSQLVPRNQILLYRASVIDVAVGSEPFLVADIDCVSEGSVVGRIEGLGIRIAPRQGAP